MNKPLFRRYETPNFSDPATQEAFLQSIKNDKDLIQKELNVYSSEEMLLNKRIQIIKELINDLPSTDPQYSMLLLQMKMDRIELDELKIKALKKNTK